jgi:hypothetical protein
MLCVAETNRYALPLLQQLQGHTICALQVQGLETMRTLRSHPRFRHERMPAVLEHFNDHTCRSSHNYSDREKNVQQINHWNVIRVIFHVSSFLSLSTQSLKLSAEREAPLHRARGSCRQVPKRLGCPRPMTGQILPIPREREVFRKQGTQVR